MDESEWVWNLALEFTLLIFVVVESLRKVQELTNRLCCYFRLLESGHTLRIVVIEPFRFKRDAINCLVASFATLQIISRPLGNPYSLFHLEIDLHVRTRQYLDLEKGFKEC